MSDEENAALVIKTGVEQLFVPLHKLLDKLLGPAATEVGLSLGDSAKVWRFKRQIRLLQEVHRLLNQSGKDIKPIATRLFFPVLEAASVEDDDEMQTRWAALLANEATNVGSVHPSFIEILRQLAPDDARLLDKLFDRCISKLTRTVRPWVDSVTWAERDEDAFKRDEDAFNNLVRLGLVQPTYKLVDGKKQLKVVGTHAQVFKSSKIKQEYEITTVAAKFVQACRAPEKKPDSGVEE